MQMGIPGTAEFLALAFVVVFYGGLLLLAVRLVGWLVDRRTSELRKRVALLEHEVAALEDERASTETGSDGEE